jgi:hypothetical protein
MKVDEEEEEEEEDGSRGGGGLTRVSGILLLRSLRISAKGRVMQEDEFENENESSIGTT